MQEREIKPKTRFIIGNMLMDTGNQYRYHVEIPNDGKKEDIQYLIEYIYSLYHPADENQNGA